METRRDRKALARDAGMGQMSLVSILAGTLAAYGAVAVLLGAAGGIAAAVNSGTNFNNVSWTNLKAGTGIIVAAILLVSYFFGAYVAGRMARRSGVINGIGVFVLGVIIALAVGVLAKQAGAGSSLTSALRNVGAPTTWHEWRDVGTVAGIAALAAMLLGSILGGAAGDRWHTKFLARAIDPTVGPEAALSRQSADRARDADAAHLGAEQRVARTQGRTIDPAVAATAAPAMDERRDRREERLTEERRGLADPAGRDVDLRDQPAATEGGVAGETRRERLADEGVASGDERVAAGGVGETRSERVAEERTAAQTDGGAGADGGGATSGMDTTRQPRVAEDRAVATDERGGYGAGASAGSVEGPRRRSFMDRLRGR